MFKILKYLSEAKAAVAAILLLLILQAYCDLSLPQYTADIVDVGISQGGIENAAPEIMREETLEKLSLFMGAEEERLLRASYAKDKDGNYVLSAGDEAVRAALNESLETPMAALLMAEKAGETDLDALRGKLENGELTKELNDSMLSQMAAGFVRTEYEALGMDLGSLQTRYLLEKGAYMLGFSILMMASSILAGLLASRASAGIGRSLRSRVFHRVVSFSNAEMDKFSTASLITRSTNDIQQIQMVAVMLLRMVLYAPIVGIGGIIKVMNTRTGMGWIIVVAVASIMMLVGILVSVAMPKFKIMQLLVDKLNLVSREILTGIPVIRAFSREKFEEKRFDRANRELMGTQLFTNRVMTCMMPCMTVIMNGIVAMIVWFGAKGIDLGNLQVGDMLAFITYTMQIVMSFLMITMISIMLPRAGVAAERIEEVLATDVTVRDREGAKDVDPNCVKGTVSFENVSFRYPGADEDALSGITFEARPGETTAIIGSTGCGKTTLMRLIPRFYDVTQGRITIDGTDIREFSQHGLRSLLGYVPQKGVLFSGTVASNIKFGGDYITDEDMVEAAKVAQAEEFVESRPERYESAISQGGTNVSGGQKQRLSIARAIAKHPKICLFDDSFSALDYKTDAVLREALHEKLSDAAIIIVAQRISTILHADRIIVLDEGRIAGIGTHEELLSGCETYREIAGSQLSEAELKGGRANG